MRKRLFSMMLASTLVFTSLTGCGEGNAVSEDVVSEDAVSEEKVVSEDVAEEENLREVEETVTEGDVDNRTGDNAEYYMMDVLFNRPNYYYEYFPYGNNGGDVINFCSYTKTKTEYIDITAQANDSSNPLVVYENGTDKEILHFDGIEIEVNDNYQLETPNGTANVVSGFEEQDFLDCTIYYDFCWFDRGSGLVVIERFSYCYSDGDKPEPFSDILDEMFTPKEITDDRAAENNYEVATTDQYLLYSPLRLENPILGFNTDFSVDVTGEINDKSTEYKIYSDEWKSGYGDNELLNSFQMTIEISPDMMNYNYHILRYQDTEELFPYISDYTLINTPTSLEYKESIETKYGTVDIFFEQGTVVAEDESYGTPASNTYAVEIGVLYVNSSYVYIRCEACVGEGATYQGFLAETLPEIMQ